MNEERSSTGSPVTPDFRLLFESLPGPIAVLAPDLSIVAVNDAFSAATQTRRAELLGRAIFEAYPADSGDALATHARQLLSASLDRVRETRAADTTAMHRRDTPRSKSAGGGFEERYWQQIHSPVSSEAGDLLYIIHRPDDVTERHGAEQLAALRRQGETFEQFFALSLDLLCIAGTDGYIRRLNPAFDRLGYARDELLARPFIELVHPDDRAATSAEVAKLAQGLPSISFENRCRCKDGSYRWLVWNTAPDASGLLYAAAHDITERKLADDAVRQSSQFLEAVLENIPHMVFVKDAERLAFVRFNRAGEELLGVARDQLLDKTDYDLFPEKEARFFQAMDRATLADGVLVDIAEETIQTASGQRLLHTKKVPVLDAAGKPRYLLGISEDITAAKQAAAERENLQARASAVLDTVLDGIFVIDEAGLVSTFNRAAEKIFGFSASEVLGKNIEMLVRDAEATSYDRSAPPDQRTSEAKTIGAGRVVTGVRRDGSQVPLELSVTEMRVDGKRHYTGVLRDISERKAAEAALAKKNQELEVAARIDRIGARVMVALTKEQGPSTPAAEVLRVLADEAGYRPLAFYDYDEWRGGLVLAAGLSLAPSYDTKNLRLGEGLVGEAAAQRHPVFVEGSGSALFALDTGVGVVTATTLFALPLLHREKLLGVVAGAAHTPLLERERSWLAQVAGQVAIGLSAIRQYRELKDLSEQLNERSRKIEAQNRELLHASRLKSEFLASMSHELRTPLNAIIGFSEALKDGLLGELQAEQLDYATEVYQSGRHLLSLINDILDLSKIEAGKMELDVEPVDVGSLVGNALTIMREHAAKGGIKVTHAIAPDITSIEADGRKLRQIIYNLLSNAVKFTPRGGFARVEVTRIGQEVEFAVVDSGIGISPADRARLFRPFEQVDGGIARRFEGTGLGLVMVKNLAELHGGSVGVESEVGKGSRFWVRLPDTRGEARQPRAPEPAVARPDERATGDAPRVLVVDDDPAAISLARRWLAKDGYIVEGAQTCDVAWAKIESQPPDAILLDILFEDGPGGWELLERLRSTPKHAAIPVVVVSIVADLGRGLALGALQVLQKPIAGGDLLRVVESLGLAPGMAGEAPRVLVVDDDPRAVEHVSKRLEQAGMTVTRAYGGTEALSAVEATRFSAVVLDLMMPEVSGFDVVRELRAREATLELPIVIVTAKVLEPAERATLARSVHRVLSKADWEAGPFVQVVREEIRAALRRRASGSAAPTPLLAPSATRQVPAAAPAHILVIEGEPRTRELLRLYLEDAGFMVTAAASVEEVSPALGGRRPDLVTLDLELPGIDGGNLLAQHGPTEHLRGVPRLFVSSAEKPPPLAAGAPAALTKPVRRHELLEAVRHLLGDSVGYSSPVLVIDDAPAREAFAAPRGDS